MLEAEKLKTVPLQSEIKERDYISIGFENSDAPEIKTDVKDQFEKHCTRSRISVPRLVC